VNRVFLLFLLVVIFNPLFGEPIETPVRVHVLLGKFKYNEVPMKLISSGQGIDIEVLFDLGEGRGEVGASEIDVEKSEFRALVERRSRSRRWAGPVLSGAALEQSLERLYEKSRYLIAVKRDLQGKLAKIGQEPAAGSVEGTPLDWSLLHAILATKGAVWKLTAEGASYFTRLNLEASTTQLVYLEPKRENRLGHVHLGFYRDEFIHVEIPMTIVGTDQRLLLNPFLPGLIEKNPCSVIAEGAK
jgi:hypothetical protein